MNPSGDGSALTAAFLFGNFSAPASRSRTPELWGWVGATLSTNLRGDKVGVYDNRKWKYVRPHLDDMLERRTVRISPLGPRAPRKKKKA